MRPFIRLAGTIHHYSLHDNVQVSEFRHEGSGVIAIFPNRQGTQVLFLDDQHRGFLYTPVDDIRCHIRVPSTYFCSCLCQYSHQNAAVTLSDALISSFSIPIEKFPVSIERVLWDPADAGTFVAIDTKVSHLRSLLPSFFRALSILRSYVDVRSQ